LTEVRGRLKSDATGIYNTKTPYGGCGGERVNKAEKLSVYLLHSFLVKSMTAKEVHTDT